MEAKYRWSSPLDWLEEAVGKWTPENIKWAMLELARLHDFDTLQDVFESDMDQDGYFNEEAETEETD